MSKNFFRDCVSADDVVWQLKGAVASALNESYSSQKSLEKIRHLFSEADSRISEIRENFQPSE